MSNIAALRRIPQILDIEELEVSKLMHRYETAESKKMARENARHVFAYKITYLSKGGRKVKGYISEPKTGAKLPCIVYNRGGSREFGVLRDSLFFGKRIPQVVRAGYIVIASQYSGNDGSEGKDEYGGQDLDDVEALYKILKAYARADVTRIGMYGGSRGGQMTYMMLAKVKWIKAAVVDAALANLIRNGKQRPNLNRVFKETFGGSLAEKKKRSAVFWAGKIYKKAPILILHGTADSRVDVRDSIEMAGELYKYKVPYRLVLYEGADHALTEFFQESMNEAIKWFNRYLKNGEPLPDLKPHPKAELPPKKK